MVRVHFLGTNGWYATPTGDTTCVLIDAPEAYIILDAGSGIYKADQYITDSKPIFLFLSHLHIDHIHGLHILNKFKSFPELTISTHAEGMEVLSGLIRQPFTMAFDDLPYPVTQKIVDVGENSGFPFKLEVKQLKHSGKCFGYRFTLDNKVISFCTDTGICDAFKHLAKDVDLLITECALLPGESNINWGHLNSEDAATLAKEVGVKKLALVHFDAEKYLDLETRHKSVKIAKEIFADTVCGIDDEHLDIG